MVGVIWRAFVATPLAGNTEVRDVTVRTEVLGRLRVALSKVGLTKLGSPQCKMVRSLLGL